MAYYLARVLWLGLCWLELVVLSAILYLLSFVSGGWFRRAYFRLFRLWCKFFVRALGVDLRLHQKNREPLPQHYILIGNHPSAFEDVGVPALFEVYSLAKMEVRDWWIAGRLNRAAGTLFVQRESRESRRVASEQIIAELRKGHNVAIYPEGGCKGRRIFASFRYGAFDISLQTGIPIVPVFLHYEAQDNFEWKPGQTLVQKIWHFMTAPNNRANYYVYDAINPAGFADKRAYCDYVHGLYLSWQARYLD
ncbi:MAG: lysophospholipid acyltransferase family protein [Acidiferrobacterales bacterium]